MIWALLLMLQGVDSLSSQGAAAMREKRWSDAVRIYQQAVAQDPSTPEWRMNLGLALSYSGKHQQALAELSTFLRARPAPGPAHFVAGLAALKLGRPCDAIPFLEPAKRWRASGELWVELGDAYQGCQRWDAAGNAYEQALRSTPGDRRIARQLAHCWWMARRYDKAVATFQSIAAEKSSDAGLLFEYGDALARTEGPEAGLAPLSRSVKLAPDRADAQGALGRALLDLGRGAEAVGPLEVAAQQDASALLPLSRAYRAAGKRDEADRTEAEYRRKFGSPK